MFDRHIIYAKDGSEVDWVIGYDGVIFYANKFGKAETYHEALEVLKTKGWTVNKPFIMV